LPQKLFFSVKRQPFRLNLKMINDSKKSLWIQIVCICIFIIAPFLLIPAHRSNEPFVSGMNLMLLKNLVANTLLVVFFYFSYYILIPLFYAKKYLRFILYFLISGFLSLAPPLLVELRNVSPPPHTYAQGPKNHFEDHEREGRPDRPKKHGVRHLEDDLFLFLAVFIISIALNLQARIKQSEKEKLAAELAYLKSQINPHFLFNTLNNIYALALKKSDDTANAIVKLSGMMRYNITDAQSEFIEIEKEIDYISSYIELQKIRIGETAKVNFTINGIAHKHQIAPLLLISFIENAFKYGVNPEIESIIQIAIDITYNTIELKVSNKIVPVSILDNTKTGTGIANVIRRLDLLYSGKYQLQISHTDTDYTVTLIITIK
jgi:hypothetical protein